MGKRFSWVSRAGASSPTACLPCVPCPFLRTLLPHMYTCYAGYDISWKKSFQFLKVNCGLKFRWGNCLILYLASYGPTRTTKNKLPVQQYKPDQKAFLWHFCAWSLLLWDSLVVNCTKKLTSVKISLIINTSNYSPNTKIGTGNTLFSLMVICPSNLVYR